MAEEIIKPAWVTEIDATTKVYTNGQYVNLVLNTYKGNEGLQPGEFITVMKDPQYGEAYTVEKPGKFGPYNQHTCKVVVGDVETSFMTFRDDEAEAFRDVADVGEKIQISKEKYTYMTKTGEKIRERLVFRKA